jgi:hydroxymethylpyrimidine pyrophosphatase-like HAD family hydrolase
VCGGGSILITAQGEVKKIHALASTVFAEMLAFVSRTPLMYFFYTAENLYCSHPQDISAAQLAQRFQVTLQSQDTYLPNTPVLGLSIYGHWNTDEDWSSVFQQFLSQFRDDAECKLVTSASTGKLYLEITPQHVHKGTGVCEWCDITKIKSEQIVGVGDSENDVEFLQSVGWSVAMGNATPSIRTLANQTIGHADQDGLAHFLESLPRKES